MSHAPNLAPRRRSAAARSRRPLRPIAASAVCALALALQLCAPCLGFASQLDTDIVCGTTVASGSFSSEDLPDITAPNAIVVGADGVTYFERDADAQVQIASITKIMTAIVALEYASLDDTVTVDYEAATVGQSSAYLEEGDTLTMEAALRALLIASGNDAGMAIATSVGALIDPDSDDPYQVFIDAMNDKAAELGMTNTLFSNPHGLDFGDWEDDMYSSARDVATMFSYAMQNSQFRALTASEDNVITVTGASGTERTITLNTHNEILGEDYNIGGKTGTTTLAGLCFVGAFVDEDGNEIYTVVLGCEEDEDRWDDTLALSGWYYDHLVEVPLANTTASLGGMPVLASVGLSSWTDKTVDVTLEDADATVTAFALAGDITQTITLDELSGTVSEGDAVGSIRYEQNGLVLGQATLVAAETVQGPNAFEAIMVQLDRLVRSLTGRSTTAETVVYNEVPDAASYLATGTDAEEAA